MTIMLVQEFWSADDEDKGKLFSGAAGGLYTGMLSQVGIDIRECYKTSVLQLRPPGSDLKNCCGSKLLGVPGMPALIKGIYLDTKYTSELDRLYTEIAEVKPNLIIAFGPAASWALLKTAGLKNIRGATAPFKLHDRVYKVFPTYAARQVFQEWKLKPILGADLNKCASESSFPEIVRPARELWLQPTYDDLLRFEKEYILPSPWLSIDIETAGRQITCIGFSPSPEIGLVVPITDDEQKDHSYWRTLDEEIKVWEWISRICALKKRGVGQNFLYDINHLWTNFGVPALCADEDTMLLHHALQPEMQKGLDFLGSIYTNEAKWKFMRHAETVKRGD